MKKVWKAAIAGILAAMLCLGTACAGSGEGYQKFDDATFSADWAAALAEENFKNYKAVTTAEAEVGQGDAAQTLLSRMTIVIADGKGHVKEEDGWKNGPMETVMEGYADWSVSPSKGYLSEAGGNWVKDDSAQAETVCRANEQFIAIFRVNPDQFTYNEEKQGYEKKENANFTVDGEASEMGKQFSSVLLQFKDGKLARFVYQIQGTAALGMKETEVLFTYGGQSVVFPDFGIDDDEGGTHVGGEGSETYQKFDDATLAEDWAAAFAEENFTNYQARLGGTMAASEDGSVPERTSLTTMTVADGKGHLFTVSTVGKVEDNIECYVDWSTEPAEKYYRMNGGNWLANSYASFDVVFRQTFWFLAFRESPDQFVYNAEKNGYEMKQGAEFPVLGLDQVEGDLANKLLSALLQFKNGKLVKITYQPEPDSQYPTERQIELEFTYGGQSVVFPDFGLEEGTTD